MHSRMMSDNEIDIVDKSEENKYNLQQRSQIKHFNLKSKLNASLLKFFKTEILSAVIELIIENHHDNEAEMKEDSSTSL